jgi:hypothetical protein
MAGATRRCPVKPSISLGPDQVNSFAQNAAPGSHTDILEDGPWLIAVSGPHTDEGGEILEGMYAQGCTTIEDSRIRGGSGRAGGLDTGSGVESASSALAMPTQRQCLPT